MSAMDIIRVMFNRILRTKKISDEIKQLSHLIQELGEDNFFTVIPGDMLLKTKFSVQKYSIEEKLYALSYVFIEQENPICSDIKQMVSYGNNKLQDIDDLFSKRISIKKPSLSSINYQDVIDCINSEDNRSKFVLLNKEEKLLFSLYKHYVEHCSNYIFSESIWCTVVKIAQYCGINGITNKKFYELSYIDYINCIQQVGCSLKLLCDIKRIENYTQEIAEVIPPIVYQHIMFLLSDIESWDLLIKEPMLWRGLMRDFYKGKNLNEVNELVFNLYITLNRQQTKNQILN